MPAAVPTDSPDPVVPAESSDVSPDDDETGTLLQYATSTTAYGYYLSMFLHLVAYGLAAFVFAFLGQLLNEDTELTPIRASLDEFDRQDDLPQFETAPEISLGTSESESSIQQISSNLQMVNDALLKAVNSEAVPSFLQSKKEDEQEDGSSGFLFKIPESGLAVTKGSFTVWTEPEVPVPQEPYLIIIEVMLPEETKIYSIRDLEGVVIGSDRYRQKIPYDSQARNSSFYTDENQQLKRIGGSERIKVRKNKVQLAIKVPGAARLVKDTIQIRSRRLRERQELELVFGGRRP